MRSHFMLRIGVLLLCSGPLACSNSNGSDGSGGSAGGASVQQTCVDLCFKLRDAGCPEVAGDVAERCARPCVDTWQQCGDWPKLAQCLAKAAAYSCPQNHSCQAELASALTCAANVVDAGLVDCTPGEPVPACVCDASSGPVHICDASGKTEPCKCP